MDEKSKCEIIICRKLQPGLSRASLRRHLICQFFELFQRLFQLAGIPMDLGPQSDRRLKEGQELNCDQASLERLEVSDGFA